MFGAAKQFSLLGIIKMASWTCLFYLASEIILSFLPHFPPLHVQTWIWSKSPHKSLKLFFSFSHEASWAVLHYRTSFSSQLNFLLYMSIIQSFHPAVLLWLLFLTVVFLLSSPPPSVSTRHLQTRGNTRRPEHLPIMPRPAAHLPAWQHLPQWLRLQAGLSANRHDLPG